MRGRIGRMRYRKLRIAWSVFWGVAAVLLVVLWVRSYRWVDMVAVANTAIGSSMRGQIYVGERIAIDAPLMKKASTYVGYENHFWILSVDIKGLGISPRYNVVPYGNPVALPYCLLVLAMPAFGVIPWIRWSNRFSLRTLLIATTLIAVVLGLIVALTR